MINSKRLTIIVEDGAVYLDEYVTIHLDLTTCGIPDDVWALQWYEDKGEIEFRGTEKLNLPITELPNWALSAVNVAEEDYKLKSQQ